MFVKTAIWSQATLDRAPTASSQIFRRAVAEVVTTGNTTLAQERQAEEAVYLLGIGTPIFYLSYMMSVISAVAALSMSLKTGPCRVVRPGWSSWTIKAVLLCWAASGPTLIVKMLLLRTMVFGTAGRETIQGTTALVYLPFFQPSCSTQPSLSPPSLPQWPLADIRKTSS